MNALIPRPQQHNTLIVYRTLPPGCIAHIVEDDYSLPFIRRGECVVVDTTDTTARVGDIYVIQWNGGRRNVCQTKRSNAIWKSTTGEQLWHVTSMKTSGPAELEKFLADTEAARKLGGIPMWSGGWSEGPFDLAHLEEKLLGAVIGLYEPNVSGMIRKAAPVDKSKGERT